MKLSFIEIEGFRGIKEKIRIDFGNGFTVINGRNGTGKSSLCDAIEFALIGQIRSNSISERGENILDYIWWCGKGKPNNNYVKLGFFSNTGEKFEIIRTKDGISNNFDFDLLFNKELKPTDPLAQLIKTNIIRDEEITKISIDLKEKDRFNFVRNTVGMENLTLYETKARKLYDKIKELVDDLVNKYEEQRKHVTELTLESSEIRAGSVNEKKLFEAETIIKKYLNPKTVSRADLIRLANEKIIELIKIKNSLNDIFDESAILISQLANLENQEFINEIEKRKNKAKELEEAVSACKRELDRIQPTLDSLENDNPRLTSLSTIYSHGKTLGLTNGLCPLCGSVVSEKDFEKHLKSIENIVNESTATLSELIQQNRKHSEDLKNFETRLTQVNLELESLLNRKIVLDRRLEDLNKKLKTLNLDFNIQDKELFYQNTNEVDSQINELRNGINILQASQSFERLVSMDNRLKIVKREADSIYNRINQLKELQTRIKNDYDTIRRNTGEIIDEQLAELSPLLSELYSRLRPHVDWDKIVYSIRGDVSRFLSLRTDDDLNPNFIFSSGQRRAVGLAFLLSVHLSIRWNNLQTLILDDPIQHIDDYRALHLVEILSSIRKDNKQIICTVEDPELADLLCRRLRSRLNDEGKLVNMGFESEIGVSIKSQEVIKPMKRDILLAS